MLVHNNKKLFFLILVSIFQVFVFSQEAVFLKKFNINGREETKRVIIKNKLEYSAAGNIKICSLHGKVIYVNFYDDKDLCVRKIEANNWNTGLYFYEYSTDSNIFDLQLTDNYTETIYFYDSKNRIIREEIVGTSSYKNYIYDDNLITIETEQGTYIYETDSSGKLIQVTVPDVSFEMYQYDEKNRETYFMQDYRPNKRLYENFSTYDDINHTRKVRRVCKNGRKKLFDVTNSFFYDEKGNLIHSIVYNQIVLREEDDEYYKSLNEITGNAVKDIYTETFYEYDSDDHLLYKKEIVNEKTTVYYYEYTFYDNGNINTQVIYQEVD